MVFTPSGDSSDQIVAFLGVYLMLSLTMARWIAESKEENTISFEHRIFSEIHQLKIWIFHAIHGLMLIVSKRTPFGRQTHTHTQNNYHNPCSCMPRVKNHPPSISACHSFALSPPSLEN